MHGEHLAVVVGGLTREERSHHGEAVVHAAPACAGVHAADLELVRIVAAQSDPEHQPTGRELRQRRELPRHGHRVAQQEQVHRGVYAQR